jgi:RNA polymerase II elongation factor ELL
VVKSIELARQELTSGSTKYIKDGAGLPPPVQAGPSGKTAGKSKFLSQNRALVGDVTRSMPPSPALSGAGSPSLGPTSVPLSQQQLAQARATRKPVVHLLALGPITEVALRDKIPAASNSDLKQALQKVGDLNQSTGKWELRKPFYKELDVWTYDYDTSAERQRAIDNAIKRYDQMRLGVSDAEWDRLLPQVERGTGKCLSKLQAQIAQATAARPPKINVQKPEVSTRDTSNEEDEDTSIDKNPGSAKGESRARSVSHSLPTKVKKASEKVVTTKRWISKKAPKQKPSPAKRDRPGTKQGKFLSSQFVSESDSDEEDLAPSNAGPNPMKRSREDEEETSDSSIPLSKKVKENHAHRVSDSSQSSRAISTSSPSQNRAKGNSPQKSSPLATSPPTNASEFESSSGRISSSASPAHHNTKGRRSPIYKRHQKSSSVTSSVSSSSSHRSLNPDVVDLARRYRSFYPKYEALHREVANSGARRNIEREHELLDMHERLSDLKKQILTGIVYVEN